jgi:hypothetical protein
LALARVERGGNWHKEIGRENEMYSKVMTELRKKT